MSTDPALHQSDSRQPDPHQAALRQHIRDLLIKPQAHLMLGDALADFPLERINDLPPGAAHTPWQVLWHLHYTQRDILEFVRPQPYHEAEWPAAYWPAQASGTVAEWNEQVAAFNADQSALLALLDDPATDLFAVVPNGAAPGGKGQTWLREFLLVADHNAYHMGELTLLRRLLSAGIPA